METTTLNSTNTGIPTRTFQQQWILDATGNWGTFKEDTDGNGTWDLVQGRSANKANEITNINNTTGAAWATPSYDKAGNMIGIPNPATIMNGEYDAWNRLISVSDASSTVTHDYDGRGYRITKTADGVVRHYYYTPGWQCVEERTDTLTSAERQFVWGLRYIDDLIIRDRSTANNGSINERRYGMQDGNWNKQSSTPTDEGGKSASAVETASPCCHLRHHRFRWGALRLLGLRHSGLHDR